MTQVQWLSMSRARIWLRVLFIVLCAACLAVGITANGENAAEQREQTFFALLGTMAAGFPLALLGSGILSDLAAKGGIALFDVSAGRVSFVRDWAIAVILGYVQWFFLIPLLLRSIRSRFTKSRSLDSSTDSLK